LFVWSALQSDGTLLQQDVIARNLLKPVRSSDAKATIRLDLAPKSRWRSCSWSGPGWSCRAC